MKTYTTSAQKTAELPVEDILTKLESHLKKSEHLNFIQTKNANILKAKFKDGSTLSIAAFDKKKGKSLAMIDHQNVPADTPRTALQKKWKDVMAQLF